jgi:hypothetical protein
MLRPSDLMRTTAPSHLGGRRSDLLREELRKAADGSFTVTQSALDVQEHLSGAE